MLCEREIMKGCHLYTEVERVLLEDAVRGIVKGCYSSHHGTRLENLFCLTLPGHKSLVVLWLHR